MRVTTLTGALALCALLTAACSDSNSSLNPTGPSAVASRALAASTADGDAGGVATGTDVDGGTISALAKGGNGKGNDDKGKPGDKGKPDDKGRPDDDRQGPSAPAPGPPGTTTPGAPSRPRHVELEGRLTAVSAAARTLEVAGSTVNVPDTVIPRHGQQPVAFAELLVGNRVHVRATTVESVVAPGEATLVATEVNVQSQQGANEGDEDDEDTPPSGVSVAALDAAAAEVGLDPATFRLTRVGDAALLASPLTVTMALTGTATNGVDYAQAPLTATFLAGQATVDVVVTPLADALAEGPETVVLTLTSVAPYALGTPTATVTIADTPVVSVSATDLEAAEAGPNPGAFRLTRTGNTQWSLSVTVAVSGTATNGVDYVSIPATVTFLAGQATVDVVVTPLVDAVVEASETVILTVEEGTAYNVGAPAAATVTITG